MQVCLAEDNPAANLIEEIGTVIEEVPCLFEKRICVSSRDEEEFFEQKTKSETKVVVSFVPRAFVLDPGNIQTRKQTELEKFVDMLSGVATRVT